MNRIDLSGKVAVVTGGSGGIGGAIAERFLTSGARVEVWDVKSSAHEGLVHRHVDVTDGASVEQAAAAAEEHGGIDILVAAAGATGPVGPVSDYPEAEWRRVLDLNLTGAFLTCRAVLPAMKKRDYGRIVTIASIAGKEGNANLAAYSAAKAGLIALTKVMALELAETGIRCNAVTPGLFRTAILDQMTEDAIRWSLERIPMKRAGRLDEIGSMVAWMCSAECSFSNGAVFDISGGRATY
jgi:3-oxoacyl-[acyl-carrier protein] reductase